MSTAHDHDRWADSLGAWLLGALPEEEAEGFRAHLAACADCRADAESLRVAVDALPASAPPTLPPPALKGRVMAIVEREASLLEAAGPEADRATAPRRAAVASRSFAGLTLRPALATGLVLLLLVVGGGAALLGREAFDQDARVVAARVDPDARRRARLARGRRRPRAARRPSGCRRRRRAASTRCGSTAAAPRRSRPRRCSRRAATARPPSTCRARSTACAP